MDLFASIIEKQALMMEAYKDFRDLCDQLKGDRGIESNQWNSNDYGASMAAPESIDEEASESPLEEETELEEESPMISMDEFPMLSSFSFKDINPEDPDLWTGKSLGLPEHILVRDDLERGRLLPIIDGLYKSVYGL